VLFFEERCLCSVSVFHALHPGHLPIQRGVSAPQSVQTKTVLGFLEIEFRAMGFAQCVWRATDFGSDGFRAMHSP